MLTSINDIPPNATSPLPLSYFQGNADSMYYLFAAGLTQEPQIACAPGPSAFADLAPAGTLFPVVDDNPQYPALSSAMLSPAPVSPLAAQVYQVQLAMQEGLTNGRNLQLTAAVDAAGQSGGYSACGFEDAAEVLPMSMTTGMVLERTPPNQRHLRRGPPRDPDSPGTPWGGVAVNIPGGGCSAGLPGWAKIFLFAGAGVLLLAAINE